MKRIIFFLALVPATLGATVDMKSVAAIHDVQDYGARGNGLALDTEALQAAIDTCAQQGGGVVLVAPGVYRTGTIKLKDHVTLHLVAGAVLQGSTDLAHYQPRDLVRADGATNIAITGLGTIDGSGPAFWRQRRDRAHEDTEDAWRYVATWDYEHVKRPGHAVRIMNSDRVRIRDVTLRNSPSWTLSFNNCRDVVVDGVTIRNPLYGPNTDGIDIMSSENVRIANCDIETGDDAIVLKNDPRIPRPTRNVTVTNCILRSSCNGFKLGTESRWGFENIVFSNSTIYSEADDPPPFRVISGVAIETVDGGILNNIAVSNIVMRNVRAPLFIRLGNRGRGQDKPVPGELKGVVISNIIATGAVVPSSITGLPGHSVQEVTLRDIYIETAGGGTRETALRATPIAAAAYPEAIMFGTLPAYGLYCRHVRGLRLDGVRIVVNSADARPALVCKHVERLHVNTFSATAPQQAALLRFVAVSEAVIRGCVAPEGLKAFLALEGAENERIYVDGNDLSLADKQYIGDETALRRLNH